MAPSIMSLFYDHWTYNPDKEIPDLTGKVAIVTGVRSMVSLTMSPIS